MKKLRVLAWITTGLLVAAFVFWAVGRGIASARYSSGDRAKTELAELRQHQDSLAKSRDLLEAWRNAPAQLEEFRSTTIPDFDRFPAFRDNLQKRMSGSGLKPLKLTYRMRPVGGDAKLVTLEFSLSGPYAAVKRFIHEVESQPEMVYLRSVRFRRTDSGLIASFVMEAYFAR